MFAPFLFKKGILSLTALPSGGTSSILAYFLTPDKESKIKEWELWKSDIQSKVAKISKAII